MMLHEKAHTDMLSCRSVHKRCAISNPSGTHEPSDTCVLTVALNEQTASADTQPRTVERIPKVLISRRNIQAMKFEGVRPTENKVTVSESRGSSDGAHGQVGCDFAARPAKQRATTSRQLKYLCASRNAEQQKADEQTAH